MLLQYSFKPHPQVLTPPTPAGPVQHSYLRTHPLNHSNSCSSKLSQPSRPNLDETGFQPSHRRHPIQCSLYIHSQESRNLKPSCLQLRKMASSPGAPPSPINSTGAQMVQNQQNSSSSRTTRPRPSSAGGGPRASSNLCSS